MAFDLSKLTSLLKADVGASPKNSVIGVDVGTSAIKIVELHDSKGVPTLHTYGELQLGPYESTDIGRATHLPVTKLIEAFIDILRESSAASHNVAVAISYNSSFSTIISVPTTDTEKIGPMIPVEAKKYVPVSLSEVTLDWFPVSARSEAKMTKILLAAIHNDAIKRYEAMVHGADLKAEFTEIEMFSTIRSVVSQQDDTVAIVDLGAGSTKLYLVRKGVVGKAHTVLMNGVDLTNALSKALGVDFTKAEEIKRTVGLVGGEPQVARVLLPVLERGFREMHRALSRYEEEEGVAVEKVILSGSGALLQGLPGYVSEMLARPVVIADPFAKVAYPAFLEDTLREAGPSFAVAVGTALRALIQNS